MREVEVLVCCGNVVVWGRDDAEEVRVDGFMKKMGRWRVSSSACLK